MKNRKAYFASANSYGGFKSNFNTVFNSNEFSKIYVIKAGPGTGKSTLMKTILRKFENEKINSTEILCSSDPHSLDGIILENDTAKIAILDGTAPHTFDPLYPGACEEIVDLGSGLNQKNLRMEKLKISELTKAKKSAYSKAYSYLNTAERVYVEIQRLFVNNAIYSKAEEHFSVFLERIKKDAATVWYDPKYYLGAFNKNGYNFAPVYDNERSVISLSGDGFTEYVLMDRIKQILLENDSTEQICYSALSDTMTDAIFTNSTIFTVNKCSNITIETLALRNELPLEYEKLKAIHDELMNLSRNEFNIAAQMHSSLEKIYSINTDFRNNKSITEKIFLETKEILL